MPLLKILNIVVMTTPLSNDALPFRSSNIPASMAYGAYVMQLIRYARACVQYNDCLQR